MPENSHFGIFYEGIAQNAKGPSPNFTFNIKRI